MAYDYETTLKCEEKPTVFASAPYIRMPPSVPYRSSTLLLAPTQAPHLLGEAGLVLIWLHLFVLAAGCADSMRLTCQVQHVPQE